MKFLHSIDIYTSAIVVSDMNMVHKVSPMRRLKSLHIRKNDNSPLKQFYYWR